MLEAVTDTLDRRGSEGWLVGGTVRDRECGHDSPDLDLVVSDDPAAVAREIADRLASPWFALSTHHEAYRVMADEGHVDVAGVRGAGILDDLAHRDFTINAMAVPVEGGDLVDPFGGRVHLREKRLVAVSEGIFSADPLRLMRAARFSHTLGLILDPPLETLLRSHASELARVAPERVSTEMTLTLARSPSVEVLRLWEGLGLLDHILPEATSAWRAATESEQGNGSEHPAQPAGDRPAIEGALERLDHALADLPSWFPQSAPAVSRRFADPVDGAWTRTVALRLAMMTHRLSPERASAVARRLRLSGAMLSLLRSISECFYERRCSLAMLEGTSLSSRAAVLFMWSSAPWEPESILLGACATAVPASSPTGGAVPGPVVLAPSRELMALWVKRSVGSTCRLPVDGDMLMRELDLVPGPRLGEILRELRLAWEAEEIRSTGEAMGLAEALLGQV